MNLRKASRPLYGSSSISKHILFHLSITFSQYFYFTYSHFFSYLSIPFVLKYFFIKSSVNYLYFCYVHLLVFLPLPFVLMCIFFSLPLQRVLLSSSHTSSSPSVVDNVHFPLVYFPLNCICRLITHPVQYITACHLCTSLCPLPCTSLLLPRQPPYTLRCHPLLCPQYWRGIF